MKKNTPVDPRVRLAISCWPDDAPRGAVTAFCAEYNISRKTFYLLRTRARQEGQAAALEPRSRRPATSPTRISNDATQHALNVRTTLEASGMDHGPISVFEKMKSMGMTPPSEASLARIFRTAGVARLQPEKKPRAAFRRFVYPAPNACWQLDATEYVLTGGRKCVIFQLEDDHSRVAVASHVAWSETSAGALAVFTKGVAARGVPQKLLTDNGVALNPSRRGWTGQLVAYATSLGVEPITGKPGKPTTQGKNERFHQTLFRWLHKQPLAETLEELQEQVDQFDVIYNTQRAHQGLPGRVTPQQAWDRTPVVQPPRPGPAPIEVDFRFLTNTVLSSSPSGMQLQEFDTIVKLTVVRNGTVTVRGVVYLMGKFLAGESVYVVGEEENIMFFDDRGEFLLEHPWPAPGITYVSNGRPRGREPRDR